MTKVEKAMRALGTAAVKVLGEKTEPVILLKWVFRPLDKKSHWAVWCHYKLSDRLPVYWDLATDDNLNQALTDALAIVELEGLEGKK